MSKVAYYIFKGLDATNDPRLLWRFERLRIAEYFGWTLEYVDTLTQRDVLDIYGLWDAEAKKRQQDKERAQMQTKKRRGHRW